MTLTLQNLNFLFMAMTITDKSSSLIASLLSSNYPITKLNVSWSKLSSSTDIIFKSLHHNTVLTELLLDYYITKIIRYAVTGADVN